MELTRLTAISPVDGRYRNKCERLDEFFSEYALIRYRVRVEVEYFIALCEIPLPQLATVDKDVFAALRNIYIDFSIADAEKSLVTSGLHRRTLTIRLFQCLLKKLWLRFTVRYW